jgi:hypothetical protein
VKSKAAIILLALDFWNYFATMTVTAKTTLTLLAFLDSPW